MGGMAGGPEEPVRSVRYTHSNFRSPQDWLKTAADYAAGARKLCDAGGPAAPIVHLAWQSAEVSLKALAVGHNIPIEHDLSNVISHLKDNSRITTEEVALLAPYLVAITGSAGYDATRYPINEPSFWDRKSRQSLTEAAKGADVVLSFVTSKLSSTGS